MTAPRRSPNSVLTAENARPVVKAFKHTSRQYVGSLLERGAFLIGTFDSYAAIEGPQADPMEGRVRYGGYAAFRGAITSEQDLRDLRRIGIHIKARGGGTVSNIFWNGATALMKLPALYVLCFSLDGDNRHTMEDGYNVTVEVSDLRDLARQLSAKHHDRLGRFAIGPVQYRSRNLDVRARGPGSDPDPFFKEPRFEAEKEVRIVWEPTRHYSKGLKVEPFLTDCPGAASLVREV